MLSSFWGLFYHYERFYAGLVYSIGQNDVVPARVKTLQINFLQRFRRRQLQHALLQMVKNRQGLLALVSIGRQTNSDCLAGLG